MELEIHETSEDLTWRFMGFLLRLPLKDSRGFRV